MHPEIDRFAHLDSYLHRWDPRWKLATLLVLMLSMGMGRVGGGRSWSHDVLPALAGFGLSVLLLWSSRIPVGFALRHLRAAAVFLALVLLAFTFVGPGEGSWSPTFRLSSAGFLAGLVVVLRAFAMILLVFPAFGTTRFDITVRALHALRLPRAVVQVILFSYRYLFVYRDQLRRLRTAMNARGFVPRVDRRTPTLLGHSLGMLLVGSVERTKRIYAAMLCRGFSGNFRTIETFRTRPRDVLLAGVLGGAGVLLLAWRIT